ncbi:hypothetical protein [Qipengyuania huizhouensis]|uniref:hypothetical protein n=1 Tax=Qipengyuania huizhouensis TaxID=2867245 RepID=UPI001C870B08|nr:hypothetical protein [Qipengyuania huizhouensis]
MVAAIKRRLEALETRTLGGFVPWVRIIQHVGQTEAEATADYEAEHGPIGESNSILRVIIRKPGCHA